MSSNFHSNLTGLDLHEPSSFIVENNTGSTLTLLKVIKFDGFGTEFPQVKPIESTTLDRPRGIIPEEILTGAVGQVTSFGFIFNVDTSTLTEGTKLYSDANGDLTTTPTELLVGEVIKQDASTGIIFTNPAGTKGDTGGTLKSWTLLGAIKDAIAGQTIDVPFGYDVETTQPPPMFRNGRIVGLGISTTETRTAGTATLGATINGVLQNAPGQTVALNMGNPDKNSLELVTPINYNSGDDIGLQVVTNGAWLPESADLTNFGGSASLTS